MSIKTKQNVLNYLYDNYYSVNSEYISGTKIAKNLGVSRNAIWKVIKNLENDGYNINSISNRGYKLIGTTDILSGEGVTYYLKNKNLFDIEFFKSISSTNIMLKKFADNNKLNNVNNDKNKVFVSSHQTHGKGRLGRSFFSPENTGAYFSILLKPNISANKSNLITILASIAVTQAIKEVVELDANIKWVNDIFINNKKICGILTEASLSIENFDIDYIVLGIGINIYNPQNNFPEDIKNIAGSIFENVEENKIFDLKNKLVASIIDNFYYYYSNFDFNGNNYITHRKQLLKKYKNLSCILDKEVILDTGELAIVKDIDENFALEISIGDSNLKLTCGEVSIKIYN